MDFLHVVYILGVGLAAGAINTLAGGGSLISLPMLINLGLPGSEANATNRVAIFAQNIFGVAGFKSRGVSAFRYGIILGVAALFGAIIGAKIAVDIRDDVFNRILAVVMVVVVILTVAGKGSASKIQQEQITRKSKITGAFLFFFIGIYGGFIQAGVGFVIIAVLSSLHNFSLAKINSIKMLVVLVYTFAALIVFIYEGKINWVYGGVLAVGNSIGAWLASRWSVKKGDKAVKVFLLISVIGLAIKLWFF